MKIISYISIFFSFIVGLFYYKNDKLKKEFEIEKEKNNINKENLEILKNDRKEFLKIKDFEETVKLNDKKLEKKFKNQKDFNKINNKNSDSSNNQEWITIKI